MEYSSGQAVLLKNVYSLGSNIKSIFHGMPIFAIDEFVYIELIYHGVPMCAIIECVINEGVIKCF